MYNIVSKKIVKLANDAEKQASIEDILEKIRNLLSKEKIPTDKQDRIINDLQDLKILKPGRGYVPSADIPS